MAVISIMTKSHQRKARSIVRIAELAGLILMAVVAVIDWGFRYYAFAVLLFILATIGAMRLIRNRNESKSFKAKRVVLNALATVALIFVAALRAILFPEYRLI